MITMRHFNVTGICLPEQHYMVDIKDKLQSIKAMVDNGAYFCINRGRQYGKSTTLHSLRNYLKNDYAVFSLSFELLGQVEFASVETLNCAFVKLLQQQIRRKAVSNIDEAVKDIVDACLASHPGELSAIDFTNLVVDACSLNGKPMVILIDEVDQASEYESFIRFLGLLRGLYLNRSFDKTFHSVILAGVYDIKNLKLKMRSEDEHKYNSPWNIAARFDVSMALSADGIEKMLLDYAGETGRSVETQVVSKLLWEYTTGYPFMVSRLCQIMDESGKTWDKQTFLEAVKKLLAEDNTLFDDMKKKIEQFPKLKKLLSDILYQGASFPYNIYDSNMNLAKMFGYIVDADGVVAVSNRIYEIWLYNLFTTEEALKEPIYTEGAMDKQRFIVNGKLNMEHVLERFVEHFNDIYSNADGKFVEDVGRKLFLLYLRPIINGVGNYYIEAQTRDSTRTDIIIDYLGQQYIVELKIWRGDSYNNAGERQLAEYLDYYHLDKGYMLSFCFNKKVAAGIKKIKIGEKLLVEAVVKPGALS